MNMMLGIGLAILAFGVVAGIFYAIARVIGGPESAIEDRLDQFVSREVETRREETTQRTPSVFTKSIDQAVAGRGFAQDLSTQLARADLKLTPGEFIVLTITSILGTGLIAYIVMHQNPFLTFGGLVLGFFLPRFYMKFRQAKRLKDFNNQLGDAINLLANGLRSGYSLLQAMDAVAREMPAPISEEFQRVVREIGLGLSNERAMNNMLRRIPSDDLDLMITAINVQHEVGGNLAEILETISHTIRERVRIKGEIRVLTSQQMISGYVVSFLPIGLGLILYAMNPDYMGAMFQEPCGWAMISVGVISMTVGFIAIRKIVNIEV
ncbi:MAG: type II secretion system F family protein [Anaerolineae bacterium]